MYNSYGARRPWDQDDDYEEVDEDEEDEDVEDDSAPDPGTSGTPGVPQAYVPPFFKRRGVGARKAASKPRPVVVVDDQDQDEEETTSSLVARPTRPAPFPMRKPAGGMATDTEMAVQPARAELVPDLTVPFFNTTSTVPEGTLFIDGQVTDRPTGGQSCGHLDAAPVPMTSGATGAMPEITVADLNTGGATRRKAVEILRALGACILPCLTERDARLEPMRLKELLRGREQLFIYVEDVMYRYDWDRGVFLEANRAFRKAVSRLLFDAAEERDAYRLAVDELPRSMAKPLLAAVPHIDVERHLTRATSSTSMSVWYTPEDEALEEDGGPPRMNADPWRINLRNGLLDLRTLAMSEHTHEYLSSIQLPFAYDRDATCPRWLEYLALAVGDPELIDLLQEWMGYTLMPTTRFEQAIILVGEGGTGKSLFAKINRMIVGEDNCSALSLDDLAEKFKVIQLKDKLLNLCTEVNEQRPLNEARLKAFISGDAVTGEEKFKPAATFKPYARHLICANRLPRVADTTDAFFRRCIVVPFNQKFRAEASEAEGVLKADPKLAHKLEEELPGIFNWALVGMQRLFDRGHFVIPQAVRDQVQAYREEQNPVLRFLADQCSYGTELSVPAGEIYKAYKAWCKDEGERPVPNNTFGRIVAEQSGVKLGKHGTKGRYYKGVALAAASLGPAVVPVLLRHPGARVRRLADGH